MPYKTLELRRKHERLPTIAAKHRADVLSAYHRDMKDPIKHERIKAKKRALYAKNPERKTAHVNARIERHRAIIDEIKRVVGCAECEEHIPNKLHFHHDDPTAKEFNIGRLKHNILRIFKEIEKCVILCERHHAKITWGWSNARYTS